MKRRSRKRGPSAKGKRSLLRRIIIALLVLPAIGALGLMIFPRVGRLAAHNPGQTAFMSYAVEQAGLKGRNLEITQKWVPLNRISPYLVRAVLIGEDDKFYTHEGFDFDAMQKAIEKDIKAGKLKAGGSTISQQLAKNLYLSPSKNPARKIIEAVITWRIERALTKKRILEIYLNVIEWGDGIYGAEAAARRYYGKSAYALSAPEAARLAAVIPNPRRYNPIGQSKYVDNRARIILGVMQRRGIVEEGYETEVIEPAAEAAPRQGD